MSQLCVYEERQGRVLNCDYIFCSVAPLHAEVNAFRGSCQGFLPFCRQVQHPVCIDLHPYHPTSPHSNAAMILCMLSAMHWMVGSMITTQVAAAAAFVAKYAGCLFKQFVACRQSTKRLPLKALHLVLKCTCL
jgi:hypothetical protein